MRRCETVQQGVLSEAKCNTRSCSVRGHADTSHATLDAARQLADAGSRALQPSPQQCVLTQLGA